jgi:hypothetical protein
VPGSSLDEATHRTYARQMGDGGTKPRLLCCPQESGKQGIEMLHDLVLDLSSEASLNEGPAYLRVFRRGGPRAGRVAAG